MCVYVFFRVRVQCIYIYTVLHCLICVVWCVCMCVQVGREPERLQSPFLRQLCRHAVATQKAKKAKYVS